jgi:hypothetical protein
MTPLELLAALVPPPRYPLVRYDGVLAPRSAWRREVVPRPKADSNAAGAGAKKAACNPSSSEEPAAAGDRETAGNEQGQGPNAGAGARDGARSRAPAFARAGAAGGGAGAFVRPSVLATERAPGVDVEQLTPNVLGLRHWSRLLGGLLYATGPRLRWSQLLRRTFDVDVMECPKCKGRLRIVETVIEMDSARRILERLGLPTESPRLVRARDPTTLDGEEPDAA